MKINISLSNSRSASALASHSNTVAARSPETAQPDRQLKRSKPETAAQRLNFVQGVWKIKS
jgi:hypothetical protein